MDTGAAASIVYLYSEPGSTMRLDLMRKQPGNTFALKKAVLSQYSICCMNMDCWTESYGLNTATLSLSSVMFSTRNFHPLSRTSSTKPVDHVVLGSEGCSKDCRKAFLQTNTFLVVRILVHTVNLLVVPLLSFTPDTFEYLPETVSVVCYRPYRFFHFSVISPFLIIVIRTVDLHQLARQSDAQFVLLYNLYRYLFLYFGL